MRTSKKVLVMGTGFLPTAIAGLSFWFDSSDASTLFQDAAGTIPADDGDSVGRWDDKSGQGNHATQSTAGDKPTATANGLALDGSSDHLDLPNIDVSGWAGIEIFIAFTRTSLSGQEGLIGDSVLFSDAVLVYLRNTTPGYGFSQGVGAGNLLGGTPAGQPDPIILRTYWDGATRGIELGGTSVVSAASAAAVSWTANMRIGHTGVIAVPRFFGGSIHEIIVYDRGLSSSDAQAVTTYLTQNWSNPLA